MVLLAGNLSGRGRTRKDAAPVVEVALFPEPVIAIASRGRNVMRAAQELGGIGGLGDERDQALLDQLITMIPEDDLLLLYRR
jgi:hypothetical protein